MGHAADTMSLYDYERLLWNWNDMHDRSSDVAPPDRERTRKMLDHINADPRLVN